MKLNSTVTLYCIWLSLLSVSCRLGGELKNEVSSNTNAETAPEYVEKAGDTMTGVLALPANGLTVGTQDLIVSGGNVGIGTATPGAALEVNGDVLMTSGSGGSLIFPDGTSMSSANTGTAGDLSNPSDVTVTSDSDGNGSGALVVRTGSNERLRLLNNGNFGVGTPSPSYLLDVNGSMRTSAIYHGSSGRSGVIYLTRTLPDIAGDYVEFAEFGEIGAYLEVEVHTWKAGADFQVRKFVYANAYSQNRDVVVPSLFEVGTGVSTYDYVLEAKHIAAYQTRLRFRRLGGAATGITMYIIVRFLSGGDSFNFTVTGTGTGSVAGVYSASSTVSDLNVTGALGIGTSTPQTSLDIDGTMKLTVNGAQPHACDAVRDGAIALTSGYRFCVCKSGIGWVFTSDGTTACAW